MVNTTVARGVEHAFVVAEIAGWEAPGLNRAALAIEASLRTERGVFTELLAAVVGVELKLEVEVPYEAVGGVPGLEREAVAFPKAGANRPARLLFEGGAAGRRDDLGVDGGAGVGEIACRAAGCGGPQRDGGTDVERGAAGHRRGGVSGGYDVGLHCILGGIGRIARGHHTLVERSLCTIAIVSTDAENDGALFLHRVVAGHVWACTVPERRQ